MTQDSLSSNSMTAAQQIRSILSTWVTTLTAIVPISQKADLSLQERGTFIRNTLGANKEFITLNIDQIDNQSGATTTIFSEFSGRSGDPRFEGQSPEDLANKVKIGAARSVQMHKGGLKEVLVAPLMPSSLDIVLLHLRFKTDNPGIDLLVTLSAWNTSLASAFPAREGIHSYLVNGLGDVIISTEANRKNEVGSQHPVFSLATTKGAPGAGILKQYQNTNQELMMGSYASIEDFRILIIDETMQAKAMLIVDQFTRRAILYGVFFLLIGLMLTFLAISSTTKQLVAVTQATQLIAQGDFSVRIPIRSQDEVGLLSASVQFMSRRILNLMDKQVQAAQTQKELETAKMVQGTFFPKSDVSNEYLSVSGFYQPATECGGDLWGTFKIDDHRYAIFIADAMGHGVPAALLTAMAYSAYKTVESVLEEADVFQGSPGRILEKINRLIYEALGGKIHMTFYLGIVNLEKQEFLAANAGHNFPVLVPLAKDDPRLPKRGGQDPGKNETITLKANGSPLGIEQAATYQDKAFSLREGDKILLFTDGLIECENKSKEAMGRKILLNKIATFSAQSAKELTQSVISDAFTFFAGNPLKDDVTVVTLALHSFLQFQQRTPPPPVPAARLASLSQAPKLPNVMAKDASAGATSWTHLPPPPKPDEHLGPVDTLDGSESTINFHVTLDEGFSDLKGRLIPDASKTDINNGVEGPIEGNIEELSEEDAPGAIIPEFKIGRSS